MKTDFMPGVVFVGDAITTEEWSLFLNQYEGIW